MHLSSIVLQTNTSIGYGKSLPASFERIRLILEKLIHHMVFLFYAKLNADYSVKLLSLRSLCRAIVKKKEVNQATCSRILEEKLMMKNQERLEATAIKVKRVLGVSVSEHAALWLDGVLPLPENSSKQMATPRPPPT